MRVLLLIGVLVGALGFAFLVSEPGAPEVPGGEAVTVQDPGVVSSEARGDGAPNAQDLRGSGEDPNKRIAASEDVPLPWNDYPERTAAMFRTDKVLVATVVRDKTGERVPGARFGVFTPAYHERDVVADENGMFTLPIPDQDAYRNEFAPISSIGRTNESWTFYLQNGALGESLVETMYSVERGHDDEPVLITLRIRSVDRTVKVQVVSPGFEPIPCEVFFHAIGHVLQSARTKDGIDPDEPIGGLGPGGSGFRTDTEALSRATADAVHFHYESHQADGGFRIWAETDEGYVAAPIEFEPESLPDLVHVQLTRCATLTVTVLTEGGQAVDGIRVESIPDSSMRGLTQTLGRTTDAAGRATFEGLLPIRVNVNVFLRQGGLESVKGVDLQPGEDRHLEIRLRDQGPVALTGRVVDENDRPLRHQPIAIGFDGGTATAQTDGLGEFTFHSTAEGPFEVSASRAVHSDTFEPPLVHAQHGTRDITFRRTARVRLRSFQIQVIHAGTLESLGEVTTLIDRGPGTEAWAETRSPRSSFEERVDASTRLRIELEGFQPYALGLEAALAHNDSGTPLLVVLEPLP